MCTLTCHHKSYRAKQLLLQAATIYLSVSIGEEVDTLWVLVLQHLTRFSTTSASNMAKPVISTFSIETGIKTLPLKGRLSRMKTNVCIIVSSTYCKWYSYCGKITQPVPMRTIYDNERSLTVVFQRLTISIDDRWWSLQSTTFRRLRSLFALQSIQLHRYIYESFD